jgi:hypothetical protein
LSAPPTSSASYQTQRGLDRYRVCLHADDPASLDFIGRAREQTRDTSRKPKKFSAHHGTSECSVSVWSCNESSSRTMNKSTTRISYPQATPVRRFVFVCCATRHNLFLLSVSERMINVLDSAYRLELPIGSQMFRQCCDVRVRSSRIDGRTRAGGEESSAVKRPADCFHHLSGSLSVNNTQFMTRLMIARVFRNNAARVPLRHS